MKGRLVLAGLALLAVVLAGCVGDEAASPSPDAETADATAADTSDGNATGPTAYTTACPPGETVDNDQGVCVASLRRVDRSLQEPFVAVDPSDPDRIAVGVNAGQTHGAVDERALADGVYATRVDVLVSEDGGASWSVERLPPIPAQDQTGSTVDPTLVWGPDGTLHAAGQVVHQLDGNPPNITPFHTARGPDGTWSQPTVFETDGRIDRPWITRVDGTVFLVWSGFGSSSHAGVAWSLDEGETWSSTLIEGACSTAGPVRATAWGPVFACSGATLYSVDTASGAVTSVDGPDLGQGLFPVVFSPGDGRTVVVAEDGNTVKASTATAPGWNWTPGVDLGERLDATDGWSPVGLYGWEAGPAGGVHVLLSAPGELRRTAPDPFIGNRHVAHVVLDPDLTNATTEQTLQVADPEPEEQSLPPTAAAFSGGDHYYGLDLVNGDGWAAWTHDRGIDMTRIVPSPEPVRRR